MPGDSSRRSPQYSLCIRARPRTPLATWSIVIGRVESAGRPARDDVLHDHQEVAAILVDDRGVDRWMVKRQNDSRAEQPWLVIQPAGQGDEVGVLGVDGLGENRRRAGACGVRQLQPGTAVGAVVAQHDRDIVDLGAGKVIGKRRRHPFRVIASHPCGMDNSATVICYFRQLPPSTGSVTPVM